MVLESKKSKIKALADLESGESPSPDLQMAVFSLGPCMVGRMRELHGVSCITTHGIQEASDRVTYVPPSGPTS